MLNLFGAPHDRKRRSLCIDVVSPASFKQRPRNASSIGIIGTLSITKISFSRYQAIKILKLTVRVEKMPRVQTLIWMLYLLQ